MERFLFLLGIFVFVSSLIFLIMNFVGDYDGITLIWSIFGILNSSIAIGVSEILRRVNSLGRSYKEVE